ncbi:DUF1566 domain-containing protein [Desulfonatronovibrio magnus]|uniref:Lcl C-terminal domain-containing protein n=1 Tax=Desulfonatronovibrio magnus TaxID=698827 RepID=UPI0005EBD788|nr:DUF1566 domain-containing protein [Desulfonatronovibrio magnus]
MIKNIIQTGLDRCFDEQENEIHCLNAGQDPTYAVGEPWPVPRFTLLDKDVVKDELTGLNWTRKANFFEFPLTWDQAFAEIDQLNNQGFGGFNDWRMPNRREMRSILSHGARKPALPQDHPFADVFLGWYWTSTSSAMAPAYAWYVHLEGARMFYGGKNQRYLVWPVRGKSVHIPATGQTMCHDTQGQTIDCKGSGQDSEIQTGQPWPEPRFVKHGPHFLDKLTNLVWHDPGKISGGPFTWIQALDAVAEIKGNGWRMPNINELESLVDASNHSPALPDQHQFTGLQEGYWSSTTSFFEADWAYVLYLHKGAVGVGFKPYAEFYLWPVRSEL